MELGRNQIVYIGNPYVKASDGLYEMVSELEAQVAQSDKLCYVIVHGSGRGIKIHGQEWVSPTLTEFKGHCTSLKRGLNKSHFEFVCAGGVL